MAKRFTAEQERILNEWARTASELRRAFPYTLGSNTRTQGFGFHLNKEVDPNGRFYIEVRQSDGLQTNPITSFLSFNADSFYLERTSNPNEIMVNFRGTAGGGASGGVTDHGSLTGLGDNDHLQYARKADSQVTFSGIITAEAFYLESAGNIYADNDNNTIIDADGNYVKIIDSAVIGNPGSEDDGISLDSVIYDGTLKVSEIGTTNLGSVILHRHSDVLPQAIIATRSRGETQTHVDVVNNDSLFFIAAAGRSSGTYEYASLIDFRVEGTPTTGAVPGKIDFRTNAGADVGLNPILAMTIHSDQHISMENSLFVENKVTAEAFYMQKGGDLGTIAKHLTLQYPSRRDTITFFRAVESAFTLNEMHSFLRTLDSGFYPSVKFTLRHSSLIPARGSGTEFQTNGWQIGFYPGHSYLTENPLVRSNFTNNTISVGDWVWLETTDLGEGDGVEQELHVTLQLTRA